MFVDSVISSEFDPVPAYCVKMDESSYLNRAYMTSCGLSDDSQACGMPDGSITPRDHPDGNAMPSHHGSIPDFYGVPNWPVYAHDRPESKLHREQGKDEPASCASSPDYVPLRRTENSDEQANNVPQAYGEDIEENLTQTATPAAPVYNQPTSCHMSGVSANSIGSGPFITHSTVPQRQHQKRKRDDLCSAERAMEPEEEAQHCIGPSYGPRPDTTATSLDYFQDRNATSAFSSPGLQLHMNSAAPPQYADPRNFAAAQGGFNLNRYSNPQVPAFNMSASQDQSITPNDAGSHPIGTVLTTQHLQPGQRIDSLPIMSSNYTGAMNDSATAHRGHFPGHMSAPLQPYQQQCVSQFEGYPQRNLVQPEHRFPGYPQATSNVQYFSPHPQAFSAHNHQQLAYTQRKPEPMPLNGILSDPSRQQYQHVALQSSQSAPKRQPAPENRPAKRCMVKSGPKPASKTPKAQLHQHTSLQSESPQQPKLCAVDEGDAPNGSTKAEPSSAENTQDEPTSQSTQTDRSIGGNSSAEEPSGTTGAEPTADRARVQQPRNRQTTLAIRSRPLRRLGNYAETMAAVRPPIRNAFRPAALLAGLSNYNPIMPNVASAEETGDMLTAVEMNTSAESTERTGLEWTSYYDRLVAEMDSSLDSILGFDCETDSWVHR